MEENYQKLIVQKRLKIVLIGPRNSGKSSLAEQFVHYEFPETSQSEQTSTRLYYPVIFTEFHVYNIKLVDSPGCEHFPSSSLEDWNFTGCGTSCGVRNADGYILVFDVSSEQSFQDCLNLHRELLNHSENDLKEKQPPILFVGNKYDLIPSFVERCFAIPQNCPLFSQSSYNLSTTRTLDQKENTKKIRNKIPHLAITLRSRSQISNMNSNPKESSNTGLLERFRKVSSQKSPGAASGNSLPNLSNAGSLSPKTLKPRLNLNMNRKISAAANSYSQARSALNSFSMFFPIGTNQKANQTNSGFDHSIFLKKHFKAEYVPASAKYNWHAHLIFQELIRLFEQKELQQKQADEKSRSKAPLNSSDSTGISRVFLPGFHDTFRNPQCILS